MKRITVYESIDYIDIGSGKNSLTREQVDVLDKYIKSKNLKSTYIHWGNNKFKFINYVGLITINDFLIEILPKTKNPSKEIDRRSLVNMLITTGFIDVEYSEIHSLDLAKENLLEILGFLFSVKLKKELSRGIHREYVLQNENLSILKGKLLMSNQIKNITKRNLKASCEYEDFTENNLLNSMFKLTTHKLISKIRNFKTLDNLKIISDNFVDVKYTFANQFNFKQVKFNRNNKRFYESFVLMKKLLLSQNSLGENGIEDGFALLFEAQDLFEKYIGVIVKKEFDSTTKLQDTSKKLMIKKSSGNKVIQLKPDIVIEKQKIIVDTKWKILNNQNRNGIQISDLYQMYVYLNRYSDIKKVVLMYPLTHNEYINGQTIESYVLEKDENKSIDVVAIDISERIKTIEGMNLILK